MATSRAASTHPDAERAAAKALGEGGSSIDAVLAGFFAAAGREPAVLFGPVGALVGGVGVGARCLDGRCLQPGAGRERPRGLHAGEPIPAAALAAVPRSLPLLTLLHAYGASMPMSALVRPGSTLARKVGAPARARLLTGFGRSGASVLATVELERAFAQVAGASVGGLLGPADLAAAVPGDETLGFEPLGSTGLEVAVPPWAGEQPPRCDRCSAVVAADGRGVVAAVAFAPDPGGVALPTLEVILARDAEPVRRGVPRVAPGSTRPASLALALLRRRTAGWHAALGAGGRRAFDHAELRAAARPVLADLLAELVAPFRGAEVLAASVARARAQLTRASGPT